MQSRLSKKVSAQVEITDVYPNLISENRELSQICNKKSKCSPKHPSTDNHVSYEAMNVDSRRGRRVENWLVYDEHFFTCMILGLKWKDSLYIVRKLELSSKIKASESKVTETCRKINYAVNL